MSETMRGVLRITLQLIPTYFLAFYIFRFILTPKPRRRFRVLFILYCLVILFLKPLSDFYWQITGQGRAYAYLMGLAMVVTLPLALLLCFAGDWRQRLLVIFPAIGVQSVAIAPFYLFLYRRDWSNLRVLPWGSVLLFWVGGVFAAVLSIVAARKAAAAARKLPRPLYTAAAVASPLVYAAFNVEQAVTMLVDNNRMAGIVRYLPHFLAEWVVITVVIFWLVRRDARQTLAIAAARENMQRQALEAQQQNLAALRQLHQQHRQCLETVRDQLAENHPAAALETVRARTSRTPAAARRYADNPVADVSLADAARRCAAAGITLTVRGSLPRQCTLPPVDLASLLYNLLSNAITAASGAPRPATVEISFVTTAGRLCITVRNPVADPAVRPPRGAGHGFGRKILREITDRYDGSSTLDIHNGMAEATVMVALPEEKTHPAAQTF